MSVLSLPEVPGDGHEEGGGAGGAATDERQRHLGGRVHVQHADGHAHREDTGGREARGLQRGAERRIRGTYCREESLKTAWFGEQSKAVGLWGNIVFLRCVSLHSRVQ